MFTSGFKFNYRCIANYNFVFIEDTLPMSGEITMSMSGEIPGPISGEVTPLIRRQPHYG